MKASESPSAWQVKVQVCMHLPDQGVKVGTRPSNGRERGQGQGQGPMLHAHQRPPQERRAKNLGNFELLFEEPLPSSASLLQALGAQRGVPWAGRQIAPCCERFVKPVCMAHGHYKLSSRRVNWGHRAFRGRLQVVACLAAESVLRYMGLLVLRPG